MNESLSFSRLRLCFNLGAWYLSICLSVCLSLAGDARGLWGERRATTKALNPSHYTTILLLLLEYGPLTTIVVDK